MNQHAARFLINSLPFDLQARAHGTVEHKTTFSMESCEFSVFETHRAEKDIRLKFDDLTFTAMLQGKKSMKLDNKTNYFDYLPGESVLVAPGETMVIDFPEADEQPSQCITLSLSAEYIEQTLQFLNLNQPKVSDDAWSVEAEHFYLFNNEPLVAATQNIMRVAMEDNKQKDLMVDFALKELLVRLMQTQGSQLVQSSSFLNKSNSRLAFAVNYIRQNLHQKLSLEKIAKMAYLSKSNFFKLFKQELGISPNEFITRERIDQAKHLLKMQQSIKEVAYQTGFSDANYFIKIFKAMVGLTPRIYQMQVAV
ncbi:MAG: AraC family transcriptional regulator [Bacteroidetes bacterium 43-16]|nr:MAG: AraC family transcriptional regulator [Bacteroidetes bacterium 43-16]